MSRSRRPGGRTRRGATLLCSAIAGVAAVAVPLRRRSTEARLRALELGERVDLLQRLLDQVDQSTAERADDLAAETSSLRQRQLTAETCLVDVDIVLKALARQLAGLSERTAAADVLAHRVEYLERRTASLHRESEAAGALAATAVAAADEVEVLGTSLRQLRRELVQLASRVRVALDALEGAVAR